MNFKKTAMRISPTYILAFIVIAILAIMIARVTEAPTVNAETMNNHQRIETLNQEITALQQQLLNEGLEYDKHREIMETAQAAMSYHADIAAGIRAEVSKKQAEITAITSRQPVEVPVSTSGK